MTLNAHFREPPADSYLTGALQRVPDVLDVVLFYLGLFRSFYFVNTLLGLPSFAFPQLTYAFFFSFLDFFCLCFVFFWGRRGGGRSSKELTRTTRRLLLELRSLVRELRVMTHARCFVEWHFSLFCFRSIVLLCLCLRAGFPNRRARDSSKRGTAEYAARRTERLEADTSPFIYIFSPLLHSSSVKSFTSFVYYLVSVLETMEGTWEGDMAGAF